MNDILDDIRRILPSDEVDEQRINRNKSVLLQELSRRPAPRGRLALRVGLIATAGVAAVGTVSVLALNPMQNPAPAPIAATTAPSVTTQPPATTPPPTSEPTATSEPTTEPVPVPVPPTVASVLAQAANVAASSTVPATGFRRIEITETTLSQVGHAEDGTSLGDLAYPEDVDVATLDTLKWNVYLPVDSDGGWVRELAGNATREALWGRGDRATPVPDLSDSIGNAYTFIPDWAYYVLPPSRFGDLPRDPQALADLIMMERGDDAGWVILHTLAIGYAPADLQAALFDAAQLLPDSELLQSSGSVAVIEWRDPTSESGKRLRLTVDTNTGQVTASDWWWGRASLLLGTPDVIPDIHQEMSGTFVDSAPDTIY